MYSYGVAFLQNTCIVLMPQYFFVFLPSALTKHSTVLEPQNPSIDEFNVHSSGTFIDDFNAEAEIMPSKITISTFQGFRFFLTNHFYKKRQSTNVMQWRSVDLNPELENWEKGSVG